MRWSYKTVHYELKKEGLLGSTFLDESEVEQSLNDYGKAGWELVSLLETMDGLIAVFKQPLSLDDSSYFTPEMSTVPKTAVRQEPVRETEAEEIIPVRERTEESVGSYSGEVAEVDNYEVVEESREKDEELPKQPIDAGTIRIE